MWWRGRVSDLSSLPDRYCSWVDATLSWAAVIEGVARVAGASSRLVLGSRVLRQLVCFNVCGPSKTLSWCGLAGRWAIGWAIVCDLTVKVLLATSSSVHGNSVLRGGLGRRWWKWRNRDL